MNINLTLLMQAVAFFAFILFTAMVVGMFIVLLIAISR